MWGRGRAGSSDDSMIPPFHLNYLPNHPIPNHPHVKPPHAPSMEKSSGSSHRSTRSSRHPSALDCGAGKFGLYCLRVGCVVMPSNVTYKVQMLRWVEGKSCRRCGMKGEGMICVHHSRGRLGALLGDERFWVPMCHRCHSWCHSHVGEARELGWFCDKGEWNSLPK